MLEHTIHTKKTFGSGYRQKQGYLYAFVRWLGALHRENGNQI